MDCSKDLEGSVREGEEGALKLEHSEDGSRASGHLLSPVLGMSVRTVRTAAMMWGL